MTEDLEDVLPFYPMPMKTSIARFVDLPSAFQMRRKDLCGPAAPQIEFKAAPAGELKLEDGGSRVTICIACMGNVDEGGDVIEKGALDKTFRERLPRRLLKMFDRHETGLGEADRAWIDGDKAWMSGMIPDNAAGSEFRSLVKSGLLAHGSIGYIPLQSKRDTRDGESVRSLIELKAFEGSGVIWPMNEMCEGVQMGKSARGPIAEKHDKYPGDLWDLATVLEYLARIRYMLRYYELTPEDAALAEVVIAQMSGAQTELATLLAIEPEPEAKAADHPEVEAAAPIAEATTPEEPLAAGDDELKQLLDRLEMVTAGAHLQLQRSKGWASHGAGRNPRG